MLSDMSKRSQFLSSIAKLVSENDFDGVEIEGNYLLSSSKAVIRTFLIDLRQMLGTKAILVFSVEVNSNKIESIYDVSIFNKNLDFLNILTNNMHKNKEVLACRTPLYGLSAEDHSVDYTVSKWLEAGIRSTKLIFSIPFQVDIYTITNSTNIGSEGVYGNALNYSDLCGQIESYSYTWNAVQQCGYSYDQLKKSWLTFENRHSLFSKVQYALKYNLGGILIHSLDSDDIDGKCDEGKFPLITTINKAIFDITSIFTVVTTTTGTTTPSPFKNVTISQDISSTTAKMMTSNLDDLNIDNSSNNTSIASGLSTMKTKSIQIVTSSIEDSKTNNSEEITKNTNQNYVNRKNNIKSSISLVDLVTDSSASTSDIKLNSVRNRSKGPTQKTTTSIGSSLNSISSLSPSTNKVTTLVKPKSKTKSTTTPVSTTIATAKKSSTKASQTDFLNCSKNEDNKIYYFRDPFDCSMFYQCIQKTSMKFVCPPNLVFDIRENVCNWPKLVDCTRS